MNITTSADAGGNLTITITLTPADDPDHQAASLITRGRLETFLRVFPRPSDLGAPQDADEARDLLIRFAHTTGVSAARLEAMMLAAHDQWNLSWGEIATACDAPRQTVKDTILRARARYAERGAWYDADGFHHGEPPLPPIEGNHPMPR